MAERRMFAKTIIDSDAFLDMPLSTQAFYFHLSMRADDDGFVNNPKKIQRMIGCTDDDLRILIVKRFVLTFDSGVIVIKHWRLHNTLRKDRYKPTIYQEEFKKLFLKKDGGYTEVLPDGCHVVAKRLPDGCHVVATDETAKNDESKEINELDVGCQSGNQVATQDRLGKDNLYIPSKDGIVETAVSDPQSSKSEKVEKPKNGVDCPYQKIIADYNEILGPYLGMCQKLTSTRQKAIQARWRDCMKDGDFKTQEEGVAYFKRYFDYIRSCDFLMGSNGRDWRADFDWIFKQQNYTKICEGKYLSR
nr:MAG TPA: replisome organizer [Caudoviricetes sp.]